MTDEDRAEIIGFHGSMLADRTRTGAFLRAILATVRQGDVVLDIGTGTGVLACFACFAGAKQVYAIEQGSIAGVAAEVCAANGYGDRVEVINGWSTDVELPMPVDVIITETIGNAAYDEGILSWVIDARDRFLRPGGTIIPSRLELRASLVDAPSDYAEIAAWSAPRYTFDFSVLRSAAANSVWTTDFTPVHVISEPAVVAAVDLADVETTDVSGRLSAAARRDGTIHGIGCWFRAELTPEIHVETAPGIAGSSWEHVFLPLEQPLAVDKETELTAEIDVTDNGKAWAWRVSPTGDPPGQRHATDIPW